jgi:hypothetical protein
MELTKIQKDYIFELMSEEHDISDINRIHNQIFDMCLEEYIIDVDGDTDGSRINEYRQLVWQYIESKLK